MLFSFRYDDGCLEVMALYSSFHIAQLQVGMASPLILGQAKTVKVSFLSIDHVRFLFVCRSVRVAEWLALLTSDHKVPGLNPAGDQISAHDCMALHWTEPIIISVWGSNMVFHALTFARSQGRCWKPRPEATVFNTSLGTWQMLMHWKTMFDCYYGIKT